MTKPLSTKKRVMPSNTTHAPALNQNWLSQKVMTWWQACAKRTKNAATKRRPVSAGNRGRSAPAGQHVPCAISSAPCRLILRAGPRAEHPFHVPVVFDAAERVSEWAVGEANLGADGLGEDEAGLQQV